MPEPPHRQHSQEDREDLALADLPKVTAPVDGGDHLVYTTDFRRVYATVIAGWLWLLEDPLTMDFTLRTRWSSLVDRTDNPLFGGATARPVTGRA